MDLNDALTILARESGYMRTAEACRRLNLSAKEMLALRRRMLQQALGTRVLPDLSAGGESTEGLKR
jgi:hypothetical protein